MKTLRATKKTTSSKPARALRAVPSPGAGAPGGVAIGVLVGLGASGQPLVEWPGQPGKKPVEALTTRKLGRNDVGRQVALLVVPGTTPVLVGKILNAAETAKPVDVELDGEKLLLTGEKEIVLRCGKATVTLTREGKVLIKGAYLLSRSSGVNRIKGGSVEIN